ncbi:hypothetical protein T484DRAFT_1621336 [Baffinella frigidus]|nr:hypothetical protein T484DRAFT_1621336 [Cryptophyta sp. CCMP2293]
MSSESYACVTYPNGDCYDGGFAGGLRHGEGSYSFADGDRFTGMWARGKKHGHGEYCWADGRKYVGHWRNNSQARIHTAHGKKHGHGEYCWADGRKYVGHWRNNSQAHRCTGHGEYCWADGRKYVGHWRNNSQAGPATPRMHTLIYQSVYEYMCVWLTHTHVCISVVCIRGRFTGHGGYCWADGRKYIRHWHNNSQVNILLCIRVRLYVYVSLK